MKNIREFFKVGFVKNRFRNKCAIVCAGKTSSLLGESKRSSETSYACERGLSHELKNRLDCHAIARNDVKIARHPELDSGAINADFEPLSCLSGTLSPSGEGKCGCAGEMKENTFTDKVYSLFTTHHSLKRPAFTLAEVLITLGIIGVVAAMTMPSLVANYEKKRTATAVKKAYSELSQALKLAEVDYGDMEYWDYPDGADVEENKAFVNRYITPYYKGVTMLQDGMISDWTGISDTGINFISSNGTIFSGKPNDSKAFFVLVDVNGFKKPNKMGTDIFYFATSTGKLMPDGWEDGLTREMILNGYSHNGGHTYTCKTARSESDDATLQARHACTSLLMIDGWEFKKDYPWKYTGSGAY